MLIKYKLYLIIFTTTAKTGVTVTEALMLSSRSRIDRIEPPVRHRLLLIANLFVFISE